MLCAQAFIHTMYKGAQWKKANISPGGVRVCTSIFVVPEGKQRIVICKTKLTWKLSNSRYGEHYGLVHKTNICPELTLFTK